MKLIHFFSFFNAEPKRLIFRFVIGAQKFMTKPFWHSPKKAKFFFFIAHEFCYLKDLKEIITSRQSCSLNFLNIC